MARQVAVVGAPSSIGIRPYDDGEPRHLNRAPGVLRERGLVERLGAIDLGDVAPPPYRDYVRPRGRARNEREVVVYSRWLAEHVAAATAHDRFAVVLGGDCSIVLGCLLGAGHRGSVGLIYVDAHADFATPEESMTGSVASMALALATGRGETPLARLGGRAPLVDGRRVSLVGRRDEADGWYGHAALASSQILDLPHADLVPQDYGYLAAAALTRAAAGDVRGFWIHVDADVLNPVVMSAVDSPEPGGPMPGELVTLLTPLVQHPRALGLSLSIYDPALDPDRSGARQLVHLLEEILRRERGARRNDRQRAELRHGIAVAKPNSHPESDASSGV
jgi:arginase